MSKKLINKNFRALVNAYKSGIRGVVLEGSSRSGKTWSGIDFQLYLTSYSSERIIINNVRETYNSFKTTLFDDYDKRLNQINLKSPFQNKDVTTFNLLGNKVNFIGADKVSKFHGMGSDFFFINEALNGIEKSFFDQLEQRCRQLWWLDYNPSASDHWVFDLEKRPDVVFVKSTFLDNPFISKHEKAKILSYDPGNPENIANGTADDYMWQVYGLGLRASPEGLIYPKVKWIDELPEDYEAEFYGADWGYTIDPTAIVRIRISGRNLYAKLLTYTPIESDDDCLEVIRKIDAKGEFWADSENLTRIAHIRRGGINIFPAKTKNIKFGIGKVKNFNIHLVRDPAAKKEAENYKWRMIDGIQLNEPVDKYNHMWDAIRYAAVSNST
jgi:PBSX family phage terminase large subunit